MTEGDHIDLGIDGIEQAEPIGAGGAAMVYRARQPRLSRTVAVKVIQAVGDEASSRRFAREARALGQLSEHPGIVTVYDVGQTRAGQPYLIMQYCEAGSLQDRLHRDGPMGADETVEITLGIADALAHAHEQGIMHRDLKPANILISNRGRHLVADFGIAALADTSAIVSTAVSFTPGYAPPETIQGEPATAASDVYSLGATMYALLTGTHPFAEDGEANVYTLINRILNDQLDDTRSRGVPDAVASIIERCTSKTPTDRPTMDELVQQLTNADLTVAADPAAPATLVTPGPVTAEPRTTEAAPSPPGDDTGAGGSRRWWWLAAGAAALVAVAVAVVVLSGGGDDDPGSASPSTTPASTVGPTTSAPTSGAVAPSSEPAVIATLETGADPQDPLAVGEQVWVANRAQNTLSVIDGPSASVAGTVPMGDGPLRPVEIDAKLWVALDGDNAVSVVDPDTMEVLTVVDTGDRPRPPALVGGDVWVPNRDTVTAVGLDSLEAVGGFGLDGRPRTPLELDGVAWIPQRSAGTVSPVDVLTQGLLEPVAVGAGPLEPVLVEGRLWVANEDGDTVSVIEPSTRQVVSTIEVGGMPREPVVAEGRVWLVSAIEGSVTVVDPDSFEVIDVVDVAPTASRPAVAGGRLWVPSPTEATVTPIDLVSLAVGSPVAVGAEPMQPAVVGTRLFVPNAGDGTVSIIEIG